MQAPALVGRGGAWIWVGFLGTLLRNAGSRPGWAWGSLDLGGFPRHSAAKCRLPPWLGVGEPGFGWVSWALCREIQAPALVGRGGAWIWVGFLGTLPRNPGSRPGWAWGS